MRNWRVLLTTAVSLFWLSLVRLLQQSVGLAVVFVLVRTVSKEQFGQYILVFTLVGILQVSCLPAMQRAVIQSVARGHEAVFRRAASIAFRSSFAGAAVLLIIAGAFLAHGQQELAYALGVAAALFPLSQGLSNWQSLQLGRGEFRQNSFRVGVGVVGSSVAVLSLALLGITTLPALIGANLAVTALQNLWQHRKAQLSIAPDATYEEGAVSYGLKVSGWNVLEIAGSYCDRLFVYLFLSPTALGTFAAADRLPEILKNYGTLLNAAVLPQLARRKDYTPRLDRFLNLVGLAIALPVAAFGIWLVPIVVPLIYTDAYAEAILLCQIITISVSITLFNSVKYTFVQSKLDVRAPREITLWVTTIRIVSSAFLTWRFGLIGAAASSIVYRVSYAALIEMYVKRYYLGRPDGK